MSNAIQIAVARADLILCQIAALPWIEIGLLILAAFIAVKVVSR